MNLMFANKTINNIHNHVNSMMKVSSQYGKKMGAMGRMPFNSAPGSAFARKTAEMMSGSPEHAGAMMSRIMKKATDAGMSERHLSRLQEVGGRIQSELGAMGPGATKGPLNLRWL